MASPGTTAAGLEGPVQIVTVNDTGDGFTLHDRKVTHVLGQVDPRLKVCLISVVGAFRTGKSFLLDMLLRYLRYYDEHPDGALTNFADAHFSESTNVRVVAR